MSQLPPGENPPPHDNDDEPLDRSGEEPVSDKSTAGRQANLKVFAAPEEIIRLHKKISQDH